MKRKLRYVTTLILISCVSLSQSNYNLNKTKKILFEKSSFYNGHSNSKSISKYNVIFSNYIYMNTNLPNLENYNGLYVPKGIGRTTSLLFYYKSKNFEFSAEPKTIAIDNYDLDLIKKERGFGVLNDVPISNAALINNTTENLGFRIKYLGMHLSYGNWNYWLGPGIHNSILMSNNSKGITSLSLGTNSFISLNDKIKYSFNFIQSNSISNSDNINFYISSWHLRVQVLNLEIAASEQKITGGYSDISWGYKDALTVFLNKRNNPLWDSIRHYHLIFKIPTSGIKAFVEIGYPNRSFGDKYPYIYNDHSRGTSFGFRKYGLFGNNSLFAGVEITRLLQSPYYNILPSQNWYDNVKYNYSSFEGRLWGAHSGSDSDDFLFFSGYANEKISAIIGWNYERHGVGNHFPPEVKFESRIDFSIKFKKIWLNINYENEYFEHYGFVDNNYNVWTETFSDGSIQRTNTLLFIFEYRMH